MNFQNYRSGFIIGITALCMFKVLFKILLMMDLNNFKLNILHLKKNYGKSNIHFSSDIKKYEKVQFAY